jgi:hypothetical protein
LARLGMARALSPLFSRPVPSSQLLFTLCPSTAAATSPHRIPTPIAIGVAHIPAPSPDPEPEAVVLTTSPLRRGVRTSLPARLEVPKPPIPARNPSRLSRDLNTALIIHQANRGRSPGPPPTRSPTPPSISPPSKSVNRRSYGLLRRFVGLCLSFCNCPITANLSLYPVDWLI